MAEARRRRFVFTAPRWVVLLLAVLVAGVGGVRITPWAAATTSSGDRAIFEPLTPARILDTRSPSNPLTAGESRLLQVSGGGGVPADATAVVLNVTAFSPTATGWLTLYPADAPLPTASNVNFSAGQTVPNAVTVKLAGPGSDVGRIKIFNSAGQTHVIIDVAGYFRGHDHDDRYFTKVQTQARIAANSLTCPAGSFLSSVAADGTPTCGVGAPGLQGPAGPSGPKGFNSVSPSSLPASGFEAYVIVTSAFVVPANVSSCLVTTAVQVSPAAGAPADAVYLRNAVSRNGVNAEDGVYGQYLTNSGNGLKQPSASRSSVLAVTPGQSVAFGAYFGGLTTGWFSAPTAVNTSYLCS